MAQMAQNMPGAGGEGGAGGFDMAAMQAVFGGYFQKWMDACATAGKPGEPVAVTYEYGSYVFDTMVPVTVDMAAITALDKKQSSFFSHYDPAMVEWFAHMVEERKHQHDSSKEKKNW